MRGIKKGDVVSRESYNNDILFYVENIINDNRNSKIAILKGITIRVEADAPFSDLRAVDDNSVSQVINDFYKKLNIEDYTKNNRTMKQYGKILHLDGDKRYSEKTEKYYKTFCKMTQSKNGMWEQRFYTDGSLAPCWGYQIDETASVVYGIYNHYEHTKNTKFLKDTLRMSESAIKFLKKYVQNVLDEKEEEYKSYDLWEENEGIHTYSLATIFSSFDAMIKIYEIVKPEFEKNRLKIEKIEKELQILRKYLVEIKNYILKNLYDNNKKTFIRNKDQKMDISLLGLVTPFKVIAPKEKKMLNTLERIELTLRTYTGGYLRYEGDNYAGGNPWVIANLWMAEYCLEAGNKKKARECFEFVVKTATEHGYLAEQIDNSTMQAKWVIGLGWSHAMFIDVLQKLYK